MIVLGRGREKISFGFRPPMMLPQQTEQKKPAKALYIERFGVSPPEVARAEQSVLEMANNLISKK